MAWLHVSGSTLSGKAWGDDGLRTIEQRRKCLTRKGCPVSRSRTRANHMAFTNKYYEELLGIPSRVDGSRQSS